MANAIIILALLDIILFQIINYRHQLTIIKKQKQIQMNQEELKTALSGVATTLNKAKDEILNALANSGNTSPEVDAAVQALGDVAQALDNIVPDAPPVEVTPPADGTTTVPEEGTGG